MKNTMKHFIWLPFVLGSVACGGPHQEIPSQGSQASSVRQAGSKPNVGGGVKTVSYERVKAVVFDQRCVVCHRPGGIKADRDLTKPDVAKQLARKIYFRVFVAKNMPLGGPFYNTWPVDQCQTLVDWLLANGVSDGDPNICRS